MAYIEPCCCDRQLPRLLREQGMAFFQTSGDVTVKHLMKSVGCMVENGSTMWLMIPSVDVALMRLIRHWFDRGWIARLKILTREDCGDVVTAETERPAGETAGTTTASVEYGQDDKLTGGLLAFDDGAKTIVIQGDMLTDITPGMKLYAGCFGKSDGEKVKGMMDAVRAMMKARAAAEPQPAMKETETEQQPAEKEVKTERRKRTAKKK